MERWIWKALNRELDRVPPTRLLNVSIDFLCIPELEEKGEGGVIGGSKIPTHQRQYPAAEQSPMVFVLFDTISFI